MLKNLHFLIIILLIAFSLRLYSTRNYNIIFDYDQYESLFLTRRIVVQKYSL